MSHVPKSALRQIAKLNKFRESIAASKPERTAEIPVPTVMSIEPGTRTPRSVINLHDVYFNGEKQTICCFADSTTGIIRRWTRRIDGRPYIADRSSPIEQLQGKVEIKRKPEFS
jgi:hypothetical protein